MTRDYRNCAFDNTDQYGIWQIPGAYPDCVCSRLILLNLGCGFRRLEITMMNQFKVGCYVYAGYTVYVLQLVDDEGYQVWERTLRTVTNHIRLNQNFR